MYDDDARTCQSQFVIKWFGISVRKKVNFMSL